MSGNRTVTAVYVAPPPVTYTLSVTSSNPNSGVGITVSPADNGGLGNGSTPFSRVYNSGQVVSLTAPSTAGGNNFQKWQVNGVDAGTSTTLSVTMSGNRAVTAVYVAPPEFTLAVRSSNPSSGVPISASPSDNQGAINGVTPFNLLYTSGRAVTLGAPATAAGNTFQKWQVDGVDAGSSTSLGLTVNANRTATAVYVTPPNYTLTVTSSSPNSGVTITVSPTDVNGAGTGSTPFSRSYRSGTVVTLTAPFSAGGDRFRRWQKDGVNYSTSRTVSVTMDAAHTMRAVYR
jgi:hypothetical protein